MIYPLLLIITDFITLLAAFALAYILRVQVDSSPLVREIPALSFIKVFALLIPLWLIINGILGLYSKPVYEKRLPELGRLLAGSFLGILLIIGYDFLLDTTIFPARLVPVYAFIGSFILLVIARNILWLLRRYLFRYGYGVRGVMIIGSTDASKALAEILQHTLASGYRVAAIVGNKSSIPEGLEHTHYPSLAKALDAFPKLGIHTVIQTELFESEGKNNEVFEFVRDHHLQYKFIPAQSEFYTGKNTVEVLFGFPVISVHQTPLIGWGSVIKRITDIVIALLAVIILSPLLVIVALLVKITDPRGPIIFKHERLTRFGETFYIYKFRSMYQKYSGQDIKAFKAMGRDDLVAYWQEYQKTPEGDDPRVTPLGKFLRSSSLDELPQLLNVLRGSISLVGPRPILKDELLRYKNASSVFLSVKPGVTGLWQVSGRSNLSYEDRIKLDLYYVQNWSLWLDVKILLKTIPVVFKRAGAR